LGVSPVFYAPCRVTANRDTGHPKAKVIFIPQEQDMKYPIHYVSSEEQEKDNGISLCLTTNWLIGTTDIDAVDCPECMKKPEKGRREMSRDEVIAHLSHIKAAKEADC
jgi:hypothetical protein